jgi:2-alkyl-3-oxoalkanoate reductase
MAVLVTGATGYIGQRLVSRLLEAGGGLRALILPGEDASRIEGAKLFRGDVTDPEAVLAACRGVRRIYHLAARVGDWGPESDFWAVNVEGTRHVLQAAERAGCERVVMVSSIVVYGSQLRTAACHEDLARERGVGPYSRTKSASEALALEFHAAGRVPITVVRPGNVFGPGAPLWVDSLLRVLRAGRGMVIGGGDGDAALAYVDHVVEVIARAGEAPAAAGRIYNATDGGGVSWRRYLRDLAGLAGARPPRASLPYGAAYGLAAAMERGYRLLRRPERPLLTRDAAMLLGSRAPVPIARATAELGYEPHITYGDAMERIDAAVTR